LTAGARRQIGSCWLADDPAKENAMFVRAVWRLRRLVDIKQTPRQLDVPTTRDALGLAGADFQKMTRGLFDR
jgi:hypothetical protein